MASSLVPSRIPAITHLLTFLEAGERVAANSYFQQLFDGRDFLLIRRIPQNTSQITLNRLSTV